MPQQDEPFTLEFPFDSFGIRGGGAGRIEFQRVYHVSLGISPTRFDDIDLINFSAAVERIRFTSAIPEPVTSVLICAAILGAVELRARKRRRCRHANPMHAYFGGSIIDACISNEPWVGCCVFWCMRPKGTAAELEFRRRLAVHMLSQGKTASEVSELVGASLSSVKRWKAAWKKGGVEALAAKPHPGRKPKLTNAQKRDLESILLRGPRAAGFSSDLGTCSRVGQVICRRFGTQRGGCRNHDA